MKALQKILAALFLLLISLSSSAQRFNPFEPEGAIGIIGGYHFQEDRNKIELGISRAWTAAHVPGFWAYALSTELYKMDNKENYGFTASAWMTFWLSLGVATTYSTDFDLKGAWSFKPMIGLGLMPLQVVYEYDFLIVKPDYDFGTRNRIAVRLNLGLFEL